MYLLFRLHDILPSQYEEMGVYERKILRAFISKEIEEYNKEGGG